MKKELKIILISFCALVVCSTVALNYWHSVKIKRADVKRPEAYSKPEIEVAVPQGPARVMELDIAKNANKYFSYGVSGNQKVGDRGVSRYSLEMLAIAPGSGWLKWQTRDGLSPMIEFKKVTQRDIDRFNQFTKSINMPVRIAVSGKVLKIWAEETRADIAPFIRADGTTKQYKAPNGFFKPKAQPEFLVKKDKSGKTFITHKKEVDKEKPGEVLALKEESKEKNDE